MRGVAAGLSGLKRAHAHVSLRAGSKLAQMAKRCIGIVLLIALATVPAIAAGTGNGTIITLPRDVEWIRDTSKNGPHGSYYAYLRGKRGDDCGYCRSANYSGYEGIPRTLTMHIGCLRFSAARSSSVSTVNIVNRVNVSCPLVRSCKVSRRNRTMGARSAKRSLRYTPPA